MLQHRLSTTTHREVRIRPGDELQRLVLGESPLLQHTVEPATQPQRLHSGCGLSALEAMVDFETWHAGLAHLQTEIMKVSVTKRRSWAAAAGLPPATLFQRE